MQLSQIIHIVKENIFREYFSRFESLGSEAVVQRCSVKKVFLEISQNSQENKSFWHRCFPVNFAKFLRTPCFIEHLWWLFLLVQNPGPFLIYQPTAIYQKSIMMSLWLFTPLKVFTKTIKNNEDHRIILGLSKIISKCFFRLHQICLSQNHKNHFFLSIIVIFLEYSTQILTKGQKHRP